MKSMPTSSAMRARARLSRHVPDQRSGTRVTARPDEQLAPNRPILSLLALYMSMRCRMEALGASTGVPHGLLRSGQASAIGPRRHAAADILTGKYNGRMP